LEQIVAFAEYKEKEQLRSLFAETDMGLAGEIEDHVLLKKGDRILAGGRLVQMDESLFHLMVFAVDKAKRGTGLGKKLIDKLCQFPWAYCREAEKLKGLEYTITTIAKGTAVPFYQNCGYQMISFAELPEPFDLQCRECPDQKECKPMALAFYGKAGTKEVG